ncbi:MAG: ribbon-helix-helix protein, CopG family [Acidimicrobiia bacterium]|nr:ribbon-helix-helix protein, CopG family [Acidimicrobiia bacterium]
MERTTLTIPEALRARLRRLAAERGVSMATLVREAIDEKLAGVRPVPQSLGVGTSNATDAARRSADERPAPRSWR